MKEEVEKLELLSKEEFGMQKDSLNVAFDALAKHYKARAATKMAEGVVDLSLAYQQLVMKMEEGPEIFKGLPY